MERILKRAVFDIETNGFLNVMTTVHCLVIIDADTGEVFGYRPHEIKAGIDKLLTYDVLIGHNIIDFDLPALEKMYGKMFSGMQIHDTLVASQTYMPDRDGGHSLKAWGVRLGEYKGDYGEQEEAWDQFSEDMYNYCVQDVKVNVKLFHHLCKEELNGYFYGKYE